MSAGVTFGTVIPGSLRTDVALSLAGPNQLDALLPMGAYDASISSSSVQLPAWNNPNLSSSALGLHARNGLQLREASCDFSFTSTPNEVSRIWRPTVVPPAAPCPPRLRAGRAESLNAFGVQFHQAEPDRAAFGPHRRLETLRTRLLR